VDDAALDTYSFQAASPAPAEAFSVDPVHTGQFIRASVTLVSGDDEQLIRGFQLLSDVLRDPASRSDIY
jgi:hypothetical protein